MACKPKPLAYGPFLEGVALGSVSRKLEEASGLACSRVNEGMLWTLNDSGNPAEIFLIDTLAKIKMTCTLQGIKNRDWEEMAIGSGAIEGQSYIYVGDIGDNEAKYKTKFIYRFEEPVLDGNEKWITDFDTLMIQLSDGVRDTEAMLIDPISNDLFLISKREDSVRLYQVSAPFTKDTMMAAKIARVKLKQIVGADISRYGSEMIMKSYESIYYWKRHPNQSLALLFQQKPITLSYEREEQGEAICFDNSGKGYFTLGESTKFVQAKLMFYKRK